MNTETFCRHLATVLDAVAPSRQLEALANELSCFFGVQPHEVGLFRFDREGRSALFVWPPHRLNQEIRIPIKSFAASLVSTTARLRCGSIDNAFASTSHLHMFEHALSDREHCLPLQKVMTAPGFDGDRPVWIVQISRKGKTQGDAEPDFEKEQLAKLEKITQFMTTLAL